MPQTSPHLFWEGRCLDFMERLQQNLHFGQPGRQFLEQMLDSFTLYYLQSQPLDLLCELGFCLSPSTSTTDNTPQFSLPVT